MTTASTYEQLLERVNAGERLTAAEIRELAATPDILPLGMLADAVRRRIHADRVTFLRVALCAHDAAFSSAVPPAAREVRITGTPDTLATAITAVRQAKAVAGERTVSGFSWEAIEGLAAAGGGPGRVLEQLREAGLDAVAEIPLDRLANPAAALDRLVAAGFSQVRLGIEKAGADRVALLLRAAELQEQFACIQAIGPLPLRLDSVRPTTGYDDVKMVAIGRLAAPNIPVVQVDWLRYGPKLAQVALTFGADDLDTVMASDEAPEGRRRAPLEEVRRNIEAAGFTAAERDGRFAAVS